MFIIIAFLVVALDQLSKHMISSALAEGQTITLFKGVFDLTYVKNTGAAFGIFADKPRILTAVIIILLSALCIYSVANRKNMPALETISVALIVGGGAGNLISRIMDGYVTDFFNFYFWPVFNVADIAICVGCALLIVSVLIIEPHIRKKG